MTDSQRWPAHLEGACYTRENGWSWPIRQPGGEVIQQRIPDEQIRAAGLDEHPELPDGVTTLFLRSQPLQNLIPRR